MLELQSPYNSNFFNRISEIITDSDSFTAFFAFATDKGISALFELREMEDLLTGRNGRVEIYLGIDAITNMNSIITMREYINKYGASVTCRVILHEINNVIFHPKFMYSQDGERLRVISGSGNLTPAGLGIKNTPSGGNWEAYSITSYNGECSRTQINSINSWIRDLENQGALRELEDPDVLERAMENSRTVIRNSNTNPGRGADNRRGVAENHGDIEPDEDILFLVREISENRVGQADIGQRNSIDFLGFDPDSQVNSLFLQRVELDNTLGQIRERNTFVNQSRNYRIEIDGINPYMKGANDERPLWVVAKFGRRAYRYCVVNPGERDYYLLEQLVGPITPGGRRRMRDIIISGKILQNHWPDVPANLLTSPHQLVLVT